MISLTLVSPHLVCLVRGHCIVLAVPTQLPHHVREPVLGMLEQPLQIALPADGGVPDSLLQAAGRACVGARRRTEGESHGRRRHTGRFGAERRGYPLHDDHTRQRASQHEAARVRVIGQPSTLSPGACFGLSLLLVPTPVAFPRPPLRSYPTAGPRPPPFPSKARVWWAHTPEYTLKRL
jgi:hypothetical protein